MPHRTATTSTDVANEWAEPGLPKKNKKNKKKDEGDRRSTINVIRLTITTT